MQLKLYLIGGLFICQLYADDQIMVHNKTFGKIFVRVYCVPLANELAKGGPLYQLDPRNTIVVSRSCQGAELY